MNRILGTTAIILLKGDITLQDTDAIVNAANSSLMGGGGVDGAIHKAGGPGILEECRQIRARQGPLQPGGAVVTGGGQLKARHVIHTVGPVWRGGNCREDEILADAYRNSLAAAARLGLRSVSFPSISTGAYGFPVNHAALIAASTVKAYIEKEKGFFAEIRFILFSLRDLQVYTDAWSSILCSNPVMLKRGCLPNY